MPKDTDIKGAGLDLLDRLAGSLGFDISRIRAELHGQQHENAPELHSKGPVRHPTDEDLIDAAIETLIDHKQRDKAQEQPNIENHRTISVELDIEDPNVILHRFATELYTEGDDLLQFLHENSIFEDDGPEIATQKDNELVTYVIDERNKGEKRPAVFLGGAAPLRINLANREGFSEDESRLVKLAHTIAARKNGYDRHLLLDEVIVLPRYDPGENPYTGEQD